MKHKTHSKAHVDKTRSLLMPQQQGTNVEPSKIVIRGAKQHNLKNIDVFIPRYKLVVITGVSGSGKSSLAFDTIYAEAQRRYLENLSPFIRHRLEKFEKPKVDFFAGLSPSLAIDQKTISRNPRSTVGTITEVSHYLRLLYSRVGTRHCLQCGRVLRPQSAQDELLSQLVCPDCGTTFPGLTSEHFSYNSPLGMCTDCRGLGMRLEVDPDLLVSDPQLSILDGALNWYGNLRKNKRSSWPLGPLDVIASHYNADLDTPWQDLPEDFRDAILYGSGDEEIRFPSMGGAKETVRPVKGLVSEIARLYRESVSESYREKYNAYMRQRPCSACGGSRLSATARAVTLNEKTIAEVSTIPIDEALAWVAGLYECLEQEQLEIADEILKEVHEQLEFLINVGLHYLTLDRSAPTLSSGEAQRVRLASQLGCGLVGMLYVLDEPTIGLHARDHCTLLDTLLKLRDLGNTVVVVEHDAATMRAADWLIDLGPGPGVLGGEVVAAGPPDAIAANPHSVTGRYLSGKLTVVAPNGEYRREPTNGWLTLVGAKLHNLKNVTARFPVGLMTCVTGVSGSGKSSLVIETLEPALASALQNAQSSPGPHDRLEGLDHVDKVIDIAHGPIGRTPRSTPATYTNVFDEIRKVFAETPEAKRRRYKPTRFSFNTKGGRCEACKGYGQRKIEMHFLADVFVTCRECSGTRYNSETLDIHYKNKSIADVLDMDVQEALDFFTDQPTIVRILQTLYDVGLGYIKLGQSATTLSGGEAQRVKLAKELGRPSTGRTVYILDEPTIGLHFADLQHLLDVLHRLVDAGNTVIVIEHNLDVIKTADWVIDLGPEGGESGGKIVAQGPPEVVAQTETSYTGKFLQGVLPSC